MYQIHSIINNFGLALLRFTINIKTISCLPLFHRHYHGYLFRTKSSHSYFKCLYIIERCQHKVLNWLNRVLHSNQSLPLRNEQQVTLISFEMLNIPSWGFFCITIQTGSFVPHENTCGHLVAASAGLPPISKRYQCSLIWPSHKVFPDDED